MKKLSVSFLIALIIIPSTAFASHEVWLNTPGDGKVTTNRYPYFEFGFRLNYDEYIDEDGYNWDNTNDFEWGTFQLSDSIDSDAFENYYYPIIYAPFLDEYTTTYQDNNPLQPHKTYYWQYCVSAINTAEWSSQGFHTACSYSYTLHIVNSIKRIASNLHNTKCKNQKYHAKHCKPIKKNKKKTLKNKKFHAKKCTKFIYK